MLKTWKQRLSLGLIAVVTALWISGCLSAKYSAMIRYDSAKDEFTVLNIYQRISAATPGDSEYLYQVWRNRDHIIRVPNFDIFTMPAFLRLSPTKFAAINLGQAPPTLNPIDTGVSLEKIRVLPGTFFLHGPDTLCYYDQVIVPGSAIDQALPEIIKTASAGTIELVDKESKRRMDGGKRFPWADARRQTLEQFRAELNPPATPATKESKEAEPSSPLEMLDDESLQLIRKGVSDGSLKVTRQKEVFRIVIPLSDADAGQIADIWNATIDIIKVDAKNHKEQPTPFGNIVPKLQPAFALTALPKAIELKIDLAIILDQLPALAELDTALEDPKPADLTAMHDTVTALRAHGVPIDEKLTVEQLAKDFFARSVKSYPSEHPVDAGDGMIQPDTSIKPAVEGSRQKAEGKK